MHTSPRSPRYPPLSPSSFLPLKGTHDHPDKPGLSLTKAWVAEAKHHPRQISDSAKTARKSVIEHQPPLITFGKFGRIVEDEGTRYERWSVCGTNVKSHTCCPAKHKDKEKEKVLQASDFDQYGVGIVLYFKYLKFMTILLFVLSVLQVPSLLIYGVAGGAAGSVEGKGGVKALVKTTMGNLGMGEELCVEGTMAPGETITLKCPSKGSKIRRIESKRIFAGDVKGQCGCPSNQLPSKADASKCTTDGSKLPIASPGASNPCMAGQFCFMGNFPSSSDTQCCTQERDSFTSKAQFGKLEPRLTSVSIVAISAERSPKVTTDAAHGYTPGQQIILDVGAGVQSGLFNKEWSGLGQRVLTVNETTATTFTVYGNSTETDMTGNSKAYTALSSPDKAYTACQSYTIDEIIASQCYDKPECVLDMDPAKKYSVDINNPIWSQLSNLKPHCLGDKGARAPSVTVGAQQLVNCSIGQDSAMNMKDDSATTGTDVSNCEFSNSGYFMKKGQRCGMQCPASQPMSYNFKVTCYVEEIDFFGFKLSTLYIKWIIMLCDVASILLFIWATLYLGHKEHTEEQNLENREASVIDYSIQVTGLRNFALDPKYRDPKDPKGEMVDVPAIREAIKMHFETVLSDMEGGTRQVGVKEAARKFGESKEGIKVNAVHFGFSNGHEISLLQSRGKVIRRLEHWECFRDDHKEVLEASHSDKITKLVDKLTKKLDKITKEVDKFAEDPKKHVPVCAFVTFEQEEGRLRAMDIYPQSLPLWACQGCCGKRKMLDGRYRVWIEDAPEPTDIEWGNLDATPNEICCKKFMTGVIAFILILISFAMILAVKTAQTALDRAFPEVNCAVFPNVTKTQTIVDHVAWKYDPTRTFENLEECYCQKIDPKAIFLETFGWKSSEELGALKSDKDYAKYKMQLSNYSNYYDIAGVDGATSDGPGKDEDPKWCLFWFLKQQGIAGLVIFGSFFTVAVNGILKAVMRQLAFLERPQTRTAYLKNVFQLVLLVQVLNTGIVTIIVNGNLEAFQDATSNTTSFIGQATGIFFSGKHQDMDMNWYLDVGTSLVFTMIINLSFVPLFPIISWLTGKMKICMNRGCCPHEPQYTDDGRLDKDAVHAAGKNAHSKSTDQFALDELYHGPRFMLELRYASLFTCLFVSMFYSAGMPVLLVIAFVQFFTAYWVDKWSFLRVYRTPGKFNAMMAKTANKLMWYALVGHICFSAWMYSNPQIFETSSFLTTFLSSVGVDGTATSS